MAVLAVAHMPCRAVPCFTVAPPHMHPLLSGEAGRAAVPALLPVLRCRRVLLLGGAAQGAQRSARFPRNTPSPPGRYCYNLLAMARCKHGLKCGGGSVAEGAEFPAEPTARARLKTAWEGRWVQAGARDRVQAQRVVACESR